MNELIHYPSVIYIINNSGYFVFVFYTYLIKIAAKYFMNKGSLRWIRLRKTTDAGAEGF